MLTDIVFLGSNLFFLLIPITLFFLKKYSVFLQEHLFQPIEDDKIFQKNNLRFHIAFRVVLIGGISASVLYMISILFINTKILNIHQLIEVNFIYFIFTFSQLLFSFILIYLILSSLLYYRFKADERHTFIQRQSILISVVTLLGVLMSIIMYYFVVKSLSLPKLISTFSSNSTILISDFNILFIAIILIIVSFYCFMYLKFSRKRNMVNARMLLILYLVLFFVIIYLSINIGSKYYGLFDLDMTKQYLFDASTGFSGLLWTYIAALSFFSISFSIFVFAKKDQFIGSQFAINYTLKLARINFYSTMVLLTISLLPLVAGYYFKYV